MNTNEAIARWLNRYAEVVFGMDIPAGEVYCAGNHLWLAPWDPGRAPWSPDTDIALWHGPSGILAEIKKRHETDEFVEALIGELGMTIEQERDGSLWVQFERVGSILRSSPAQLAAALRKCIEGGAS